MAAAARALWFLVVSVVGACALISREGTGMARVTKTLATVIKKSAQPQPPGPAPAPMMDDSTETSSTTESTSTTPSSTTTVTTTLSSTTTVNSTEEGDAASPDEDGSAAEPEPEGTMEDVEVNYEPITYTEEPLKYSWRGKANIYGQPLAVCGDDDIDCETGGENRVICLRKMPMDYCETVGLAGDDSECETVQGIAWCVNPGSYSLYVSKKTEPLVECSAIPDGLFDLPMDEWKEFKSIEEADQELNGLKALYKQCNTTAAKTKFKKNFCEFTALDAQAKHMEAEEPFTDCFRIIRRQRRRALARSMARGLKRRLMRVARRFTSP